jgi:ACS family glucarate transporter-like MFS transporter
LGTIAFPNKTGTKGVPLRFLLALCIFALSAVAYLDRTNISIAGVHIGKEFGIDNTHLGWVFSAFLIGYTCFQIPGGLLARRLGPRRVLALTFLWLGVFSLLTSLVPAGVRGAVLLLALVRFALGAGEATLFPAATQIVERWFPVSERGKANGLIFAGVGTGSGLTPPLVTAIILHYGWRAAFWFSALLETTIAAIWFSAARDTPEQHPLVREYELVQIQQGRITPSTTGSDAGLNSRGSRRVPWKKILGSKKILALTGSYFTYGYVTWIFFGWFYIYLAQVRGLNLKASALYSMLPFVGMMVGSLLGGVASDGIAGRFGLRAGRCMLPVISMAVTAILMVLGSRAQHAEGASLILAVGVGALYLSQSSFFAVTADFAGEYTSVVSGIVNMGGQIGGACTASLTPLIAAHFGWEMSFLAAALLALLGAVAWLAVDPLGGLHEAEAPN